ncbi:hypothetical protein [Pseudidiomarina sp.]|uniref:hypothetical protein n=1 Tax=Pseudidiomarina sp. TaxID=2081707 RepID=UPI003A96D425
MSRWQDKFNSHPFQTIWAQISDKTDNLTVDDDSIESNVEEIARLKKVVSFISSLLNAIDPDLVPLKTWQNFHGQCQPCLNEITAYESNRNIQHITNANDNHLDNLLTYLRPYVVSPDKATIAATKALKDYSKTISSGLTEFKNHSLQYYKEFKAYSDELRDLKIGFIKQFESLDATHQKVDSLRVKYFDGTEEEEAIDSKVNEMVSNLEDYYTEISEYYKELLESGSDSISNKIKVTKDIASESSEKISELLLQTEKQLKELKSFYTRVVGAEDEDGNVSGGLQEELNSRKEALDNFKKEQEIKYKTLNEQIESLLPGATSAGLATAYRAMRKSFSQPIKQYSNLFYVSVAILTVIAFISTVDTFWTDTEIFKFVDVSNMSNLLSNLTYKLPIILPVLWLALFASRRRNEAQRLQQEYAHKEALAKSYQSFKDQIDNLKDGKKEELLEQLLAAAIGAVAANASESLDRKHNEETPIHLGLDTTVSQLEKLRGIFK